MQVDIATKKLIVFKPHFRQWLMWLARRYNAPVYLVGSALRRTDPRDIDILVILPDEEFAKRFGQVQAWMEQGDTGEWGEERYKWNEECSDISKRATEMFGVDIDFKIEPQSEVDRKYKNKPHMRLA